MSYPSLRHCVEDLERHGQLLRVTEPVSPHLELAEIQRRAYLAGAPALLFERVEGTGFPCLSNLFGTMERCRFIFRKSIERVKKIVRLKAEPGELWRHPLTFAGTPFTALKSCPLPWPGKAPSLEREIAIADLPQIVSWPDDGGPFITLPQVYSEDPEAPGWKRSNLGMYRIQLAGNDYVPEREIGLHYQIHRGIGVHHSRARERGERLPVSIFVGGPPAHTLAAVMPLPEGLSELIFAGLLGARHFRYRRVGPHLVSADADFVIRGSIDPLATKPEGPFGDHLGYYSLTHDFPVLEVEAVTCRRDAIWPLTVVGRPPQEDTSFGQLIHEITAPMVPKELPGVHALHAVDAAGVHPLLLAIGSERYVPWEERRRPRELLTLANAILGFGQCSLAKYLFLTAREDAPDLDIHDIAGFLRHVLERVDLERDLHFQTRTNMDTLDYSGGALNEGSKLVVVAAGPPRRQLAKEPPASADWPAGLGRARPASDGLLLLEAGPYRDAASAEAEVGEIIARLESARPGEDEAIPGFPLLVLVDDLDFAAEHFRNFLWLAFTRSNPSHDLHGLGAFTEHKHWGARRGLLLDARRKPWHAPPLVEDPAVSRRVDELLGPGKSLHGVL